MICCPENVTAGVPLTQTNTFTMYTFIQLSPVGVRVQGILTTILTRYHTLLSYLLVLFCCTNSIRQYVAGGRGGWKSVYQTHIISLPCAWGGQQVCTQHTLDVFCLFLLNRCCLPAERYQIKLDLISRCQIRGSWLLGVCMTDEWFYSPLKTQYCLL